MLQIAKKQSSLSEKIITFAKNRKVMQIEILTFTIMGKSTVHSFHALKEIYRALTDIFYKDSLEPQLTRHVFD